MLIQIQETVSITPDMLKVRKRRVYMKNRIKRYIFFFNIYFLDKDDRMYLSTDEIETFHQFQFVCGKFMLNRKGMILIRLYISRIQWDYS